MKMTGVFFTAALAVLTLTACAGAQAAGTKASEGFFSALFSDSGKADEEGSCGEDLRWEYYKRSKKLVITGSGEMHADKFLWSDYPIHELVLPEGLVSISESVFYNNHQLKGELKLPQSLKRIEAFAFYGCNCLTGGLAFPEGLESIGDYAFDMCKGLNGSLSFPSTLKSIGDECFSDCAGLSGELRLPDGLESIGRVAFSNCAGLTGDLILPDSLTKLGAYTFQSCAGFDGHLKISGGLERIGQNVFYGCEKLRGDLVIPASVKEIGENAFGRCGFDGVLRFEGKPEVIGSYAFHGMKALKGRLELPDSLKYLGGNAFGSCESLEALKLPAGLLYVPEGCFSSCKGMTGSLELPEGLLVIGNNAFSYSGFSGVLKLPERLESLGPSAFAGCSGLTGALVLPESLLHIKEWAFYNCSGLSGKLSIPDRVVCIGDYAFYGTGIEEAVFGKGLESLGSAAFAKCGQLRTAVFQSSMAPDYYAEEDGKKSFPEGCSLSGTEGRMSVRNVREQKAAAALVQQAAPDNGQEREVPWTWADALRGSYQGHGSYADCELNFDGSKAELLVNGRLLSEADYEADPNSDEQKIITENFYLRDGMAVEMELSEDRNFVLAKIAFPGGKSVTAVFSDYSEEKAYQSADEGEIPYPAGSALYKS